jgi:hypothetical protein
MRAWHGLLAWIRYQCDSNYRWLVDDERQHNANVQRMIDDGTYLSKGGG